MNKFLAHLNEIEARHLEEGIEEQKALERIMRIQLLDQLERSVQPLQDLEFLPKYIANRFPNQSCKCVCVRCLSDVLCSLLRSALLLEHILSMAN